MNDENVTVGQDPDPEAEPAKTDAPMSDKDAKEMFDESDAEYSDFHVFYHDTMNFLADRVFNNNDRIDYPALLQVFVAMHRSAPLGSTTHDVLDDHLDDLVTPLLSVLFGH